MLNETLINYYHFKTVYKGEELSFDLHMRLSEVSKYETFLVSHNNSYFALKNFKDKTYQFDDEARFRTLSHPRLATPLLASSGHFSEFSTISKSCNFILTEFCPNGDLFSLLMEKKILLNEKMARYYFRQLVEGVEYMHSLRTAHLDIKLCNIFLDQDFNLKLGDFDFSSFEGDGKFEKGSEDFRAPEVKKKNNYDIYKADIYSMGIVLFCLKIGNHAPFYESHPQLQRCFYDKRDDYWKFWKSRIMHLQGCISESFISLFTGMTREKPEERWTLDQIKASEWYNDETYAKDEISSHMMNLTIDAQDKI
jgi:serine/threonine protein kinase